MAANKLAQRRLTEILDKFSRNEVELTIERLFEYTKRRTEAEIAKWPAGVYLAETFVDDDGVTGKPIHIPVKLTIKDNHVNFDLTGADPQRKAPMNSTYAQSYASVAYTIKALIPVDIPVNNGFYEVVTLTAEKGTVVNATRPAAVVGGWEVGIEGHRRCVQGPREGDAREGGGRGEEDDPAHSVRRLDPRTNNSYVDLETMGGGYGGRARKDGEDAVQAHHQNTENAPIEEMEFGYPVMIDRYQLVPNSDGPGEFRGGLGLLRMYRFRNHEPTVTFLADTVKIPPHGMLGGLDGQPAEFSVYHDGVKKECMPSKVTFYAAPGDLISIRTPGGGGYGDPLDRDPDSVLSDVVQEKVSLKRGSRSLRRGHRS